jgi:hypothetical protein
MSAWSKEPYRENGRPEMCTHLSVRYLQSPPEYNALNHSLNEMDKIWVPEYG